VKNLQARTFASQFTAYMQTRRNVGTRHALGVSIDPTVRFVFGFEVAVRRREAEDGARRWNRGPMAARHFELNDSGVAICRMEEAVRLRTLFLSQKTIRPVPCCSTLDQPFGPGAGCCRHRRRLRSNLASPFGKDPRSRWATLRELIVLGVRCAQASALGA
jgi:hypothetical protein